jgi:hypothetical protein
MAPYSLSPAPYLLSTIYGVVTRSIHRPTSVNATLQFYSILSTVMVSVSDIILQKGIARLNPL